MKCPKCGSIKCSIVTSTKETGKDYSFTRGILGELFAGPLGMLAGWKNNRTLDVQAYWKCDRCGYKFKAQ